ncbi:MAG: hypothetical protein J7L96_08790, partial [Bacteroidales bacterium]|nr:hypothetical protein [Bacteroidales bacterium]
MGGTEIGKAIDTALADPFSQDVILVTDGEVWGGSEVIEKASRSGRRIFTVGVGSAVAEGFVRSLAEKTGGACELVSPNEEMSDKIVRHAARIFKPYCKQVNITWPGTPIEKIPLTQGSVFSGDTKFIFARYNEPPKSKVQLACKLDDGLTSLAEVELDTSLDDGDNTLARLIAHETLSQLDDEQVLQACLKYQLMSDKTNYLVIDSEGEKAEQLPGLRKIPNTLAAGWGGSGTIIDKQKMCSVKECDTIIHNCMLSVKKCLSPPIVGRMKDNPASYDIDLNKIIREHFSEKNPLPIISIDELFTMGFAEIIIDELRNLVDSGFHEEAVVAAFMISLARKEMGRLSKVATTVYNLNNIDKNLLKLTRAIVFCHNL